MDTYGDVLDHLRREVLRDTQQPYLWSDEVLCEFIAQAEDEFAERVQHIRDSSSIAASFELEEGVELYTLNSTVLSVMTARVEGAATSLVRATSSAIDGYAPPPDTIAWLESINYGVERDGTPLAFTTDDSLDSGNALVLRVWPTPAAADAGKQVKMRVIRLPLVPCSLDVLDARPEVPRQFIPALCHGAAARAYTLQDADGNDPVRGSTQQALFESYLKRANTTIRRKLFQPLAWGFGRGGFSHSR